MCTLLVLCGRWHMIFRPRVHGTLSKAKRHRRSAEDPIERTTSSVSRVACRQQFRGRLVMHVRKSRKSVSLRNIPDFHDLLLFVRIHAEDERQKERARRHEKKRLLRDAFPSRRLCGASGIYRYSARYYTMYTRDTAVPCPICTQMSLHESLNTCETC